jgi:hypothetical protein
MAEDIVEIRRIQGLGRTVRWFIWIIGALLAVFFGWLQFRNFPVRSIFERAEPDFLLRLTLALYYTCWIFGSTFDTNIQTTVYLRDPNQGLLPRTAYVLLIGFGVVAAILLWASESERYFAGVLTGFIVFNILGFIYILSVVRPMINVSRERYALTNDLFGIEQLNLVARYMTGRWQFWRFVVMILMIAGIDTLIFSDEIHAAAAGWIANLLPPLTVETISRLIPSLSFLVFVLVAEGWIFTQRLKVRTALVVIDELSDKYDLTPKAGSAN